MGVASKFEEIVFALRGRKPRLVCVRMVSSMREVRVKLFENGNSVGRDLERGTVSVPPRLVEQ